MLFNACKREKYHPNSGYKKLFRRLRATYKVSANKDDLSPDRLDEANLMIFGGPRERFTEHEIQQLKTFVKKGGSVLLLVGEGGDEALGTNVNSIIEEYGMTVRQDSVVRTVYYKYLYPKEVFIANGVLQPAVAQNKNVNAKSSKNAGKAHARKKAATKRVYHLYICSGLHMYKQSNINRVSLCTLVAHHLSPSSGAHRPGAVWVLIELELIQ